MHRMYGAVITMKAGIMALTVIKTLLKGPSTIRYPYQPAKVTPITRGHLTIDINDCIFCGLCRMHCPADAITVSKPERTWELNQFQCVICGCCVSYCPKDCLSIEQTYLPPAVSATHMKIIGPEPEKSDDQEEAAATV